MKSVQVMRVFDGDGELTILFRSVPFHPIHSGLRSLPRDTLDDAMTAAECLIVSKRSCDAFDAYVLSESSLFVYPTKVVLKTCGTTKLLKAIPMFIEEAAKLGMKPRRAKYTRSTFMWPDEQPLEGDFDREVDFLETHFGALGDGGNAFVLGSKTKGVQWHVYLADDNSGGASLDGNNSEGSECSTGGLETHVPAGVHRANQPDPTVSLEVCMTHLDRTHSKHFFRDDTYESCQQTTKACGISDLFPKFDIDPYVFEPCGYSMNGLSGAEYSTIHITPEDGFSYCSVERSNIPVSMADPEDYLRRVASTFKPGKFSFAVSTDAALPDACNIRRVPTLPGYRRIQASHQEVDASGGAVSFYTFVRLPDVHHPVPDRALPAVNAKAAKPGFETGTDSDEDAPDRKKFRPLLDTPDIAREVRPTSIVSSHVAESAFDLNRCPSVNNLDLPAHVQSTLSNHMTEFAGIATLRTPLPTSLPLARAFGEYDSDVVNALVGAHCKPVVGSGGKTIDNFCLDIIENGLSLPATDRLARFCVVDLGVVMRRWKYWRATMPRVMPHYAVKCNPDTQVLATLAALGSSFDCASPAEVDMVTALGVSPDRIIYANPCKMPAHLARVRDSGVGLTTFDSVAELHKIYELSPDMKVLLRLRADDPDARCVLGNKYGAEPTEIEPLLTAAKHLGVNVEGVAFHVGSGATNPRAFREALERARLAFDIAERVGLPPLKVVDIGGGFSGSVRQVAATQESDVTLTEVANMVNATLDSLFPVSSGVRVIAEPGRYFAEATTTLATMVFSRRIRSEEDGSVVKGGDTHQYFVSDGLYGMMNCLMYDHASITARMLPVSTNAAALAGGNLAGIVPRGIYSNEDDNNEVPTHQLTKFPSTVFGPTCDGIDKVLENTQLPEVNVGDWLVFPHMGAYTVSAGSNFNGFECGSVRKYYVASIVDGDPDEIRR